MPKLTIFNLLYMTRDLRSKKLFLSLKKYCSGDVLDVGGGNFYQAVQKRDIKFQKWTTLDQRMPQFDYRNDPTFKFVKGNGCQMPFKNNQYDTVVNIQVLEHVLEPIKMIEEISRVLKPKGYAIFLIPQTCTIHDIPYNYYNFTRFWIEAVMRKNRLKIVELKPLGGVWSSMASHLFYFYLQSLRYRGMTSKFNKRNIFFYILYPIMFLYALINIPICLILSLGDLSEEPNNHLVIVKKTV